MKETNDKLGLIHKRVVVPGAPTLSSSSPYRTEPLKTGFTAGYNSEVVPPLASKQSSNDNYAFFLPRLKK